MLVFGRNNDDKGAQLEHLATRILAHLGYFDIVVNRRGPGGDEIDVTAEYRFPALDSLKKRRLVCECKAQATPINMTDWEKFLGKVYVEETVSDHQEVQACMIALAGANGNVVGSYDLLRRRRDSLSLIFGDTLYRHLSSLFNMAGPARAEQVVHAFTS